MMEILLGLGVATFIVYTVFHIIYILSLKRTSDRMAEFLRNTETNVNGTLEELRGSLENVRKISGNVREVSEDVRQIARTAARVEQSIRGLYLSVAEALATAAETRMAGIKAGVKAGVATLVKNLREERSDEDEGGTGKEGR